MRLEFNSVDEVKEFVAQLKGKRGAKGGDDDTAVAANPVPTPVMPPPATGFAPGPQAAFVPPGMPGFNPAPPPPVGYPSGPTPEVLAMIGRICNALDLSLARGQPAETALAWFRQQCGPEAAAATMDQVKSSFLPRMTLPALEQIAKLMGG